MTQPTPLTQQQMDTLLDFCQYAKQDDFARIFGDALASHVWSKFVQEDHNVIQLYRRLDTERAAQLIEGLSQWPLT